MNHTEIYEYTNHNDKLIFMTNFVEFLGVIPYFTFYDCISNGLHT